MKSKDFADLCKVNFCINKIFIECYTGSCCVHITGGVNTYLHMCASYWSLYVLCVFDCEWLSNHSTIKNHVIHALSLMPCWHSKVLTVLKYQDSVPTIHKLSYIHWNYYLFQAWLRIFWWRDRGIRRQWQQWSYQNCWQWSR